MDTPEDDSERKNFRRHCCSLSEATQASQFTNHNVVCSWKSIPWADGMRGIKEKGQTLTFKTKFRIGQEVIFEDVPRKIVFVSIFVSADFKNVKYYLDNGDEVPIIANEDNVKPFL